MKKKLKRVSVFELFYVLKNDMKDDAIYDNRFSFAMDRNISNFQSEVESLLKARRSKIPEFIEFEKQRDEILKNFVVSVDEKGLNTFRNDEEKELCKIQVNDLVDKYKDVLNKRQEEMDKYNELLEEEIDVDIVQCSFKTLPNLNKIQMNVLRPMIKESDEEIENML